MDFDPILLRAFVAVTEAGGFTRAAQRLNLTQSAVSHQIRRLEEQVGRPLLHRTTRSLKLTEDGEDFLRHAQGILRSLDALAQRFQPSPITGVVRFGAPENFMGDRLPPLLGRFARAFPDVRLEVSIGLHIDLRAMVLNGELDLAVVVSPSSGAGERVLRRSPFVWVAAETFEAPRDASLPFAFAPMPCVSRQVGIEALERTALDWHIVFTSPSLQDLQAAVSAGLAVAVMTRDELRPGLRVIDGEYGLPPLPDSAFSLIWGEGGRSAAACEFGRLVESVASESAGVHAG